MSKILSVDNLNNTKLFHKLSSISDQNASFLAANILQLCNSATEHMKLISSYFPQYTLHDEVHLLRVTELMAFILGNTLDKLNYIEISLLILSAYFHDIGMIPLKEEMESLEHNQDFLLFRDRWIVEHPNYRELQQIANDHLLSGNKSSEIIKRLYEINYNISFQYLRSQHAYRSGEHFRNCFSTDKRIEIFGINLSEYVAKLCTSHGLLVDDLRPSNGFHYDEQIGRLSVNLPYLAIVLRLADLLDFDRERTPDVLFQSMHFTNNISINEWEKHRGVHGWSIEGDKIRFTMYFNYPVYENVAREFLNYIDDELFNCHLLCQNFPQEFASYKLDIPQKVDRSRIGSKDDSYIYFDLEFSLSRDEIVNLLLKNNLYDNPSLCIRELLQNSADALRMRKALFKESNIDWKDGKIIFEHFLTKEGIEVLKCQDNGCGMDEYIIRNFFIKVGRSYYKSPDFLQKQLYLKKMNADFDPCSQFGIGFMSCFMLGDKIVIHTKRDNGQGKDYGNSLIMEINGTGGIVSLRKGDSSQPIGTTVLIYGRKKPGFFDKWTDQVRLTTVLKGYACAIEFPIVAKCSIPEIYEEIIIDSKISLFPTFLENNGLQNITTYCKYFNEYDKNLNGVIKESFQVANNIPCIANNEAQLEVEQKGKTKNFVLKKAEGRSIRKRENGFISVCMDGVLVAGNPGRPEYDEMTLHMLGWRNSNIYTHCSCIIDIRGELKPEITPSRVPVKFHFGKLTPKWNRINDYVQKAAGDIWNHLCTLIDEKSFTSEIFWKLGTVYSFPIFYVTYHSIWNNLSFSFINYNGGTYWKKLSEIKSLVISEEGDELLVPEDNTKVALGNNLKKWEATGIEHPLLIWYMNMLIILSSKLNIEESKVTLLPNHPINKLDRPSTDIYNNGHMTFITSSEYSGEISDVLSLQILFPTYNKNHPLAKILKESTYISKKTDIQEFAQSFILGISNSLRENKETMFKPSRWLKYIGYKYFSVDWAKYPAKYKAPYTIWLKEKGKIKITEEMFDSWKRMEYKED